MDNGNSSQPDFPSAICQCQHINLTLFASLLRSMDGRTESSFEILVVELGWVTCYRAVTLSLSVHKSQIQLEASSESLGVMVWLLVKCFNLEVQASFILMQGKEEGEISRLSFCFSYKILII